MTDTADASTLERFACAGFRIDMFDPAYGMAETTLVVAGVLWHETPVLTPFDAEALSRDELAVPADAPDVPRLVSNGRNLHPHDIERECSALRADFDGLACCVTSVFPEAEQIVVLQELRRGKITEPEPALPATEVRGGPASRIGVRVPNPVLVRPGRVQKTTGGKIRRSLMRELFTAGRLEALHEDLEPAVAARYRSGALAG